MRRFLSWFLVLFMTVPFSSEAQTLTNRDRRHINTRVLNLIEEYERTAVVNDDDAEYVFCDLFENDQLQILCDVLGFPGYLSQMTVADYVRALRSDAMAVTMEIKNFVKGDMRVSGSECIVPVSFQKSVSYVDRNGYVFSTEAYYQTDLDMEMLIRYDLDTDECKIVSLDGKVEADRQFPRGRFFIINKSQLHDVEDKQQKYLSELKIGGMQITYNEFDQAILPAGHASVNDIDVVVSPDTLMKGPNYDVMKFSFKPRKSRLKLHYGIAPFGAYKVTSSGGLTDSRTSAMEFGLDIGFTWRAGKSSKMGFFFGAGAQMGNIDLSLNRSLDYSYKTCQNVGDREGFSHFKESTLNYTIKSATEGLNFTDIYVPVYFELEHRAGKHMLISWNFGVKGYYNMLTSYVPYQVSGQFSMTDVSEKPFDLTDVSYISPSSYKRNPFDLSLFGNIGFDINIGRQKVYLSFKGGYEYGLTTSYKNNNNTYFVNNSTYFDKQKIFPVVYDAIYGRHIPMHSLITDLEYCRRAIWLQAGLKFKI